MASTSPVRGEVWDVDLDPPMGHEQVGRRPALVVSVDQFNQGLSGLVIVVPISLKDKSVRSHVTIEPDEGGLKVKSFAKCETIRSISTERLTRRRGTVSDDTLDQVADRLRLLLDL
jgi:mRNA interferase MazF